MEFFKNEKNDTVETLHLSSFNFKLLSLEMRMKILQYLGRNLNLKPKPR